MKTPSARIAGRTTLPPLSALCLAAAFALTGCGGGESDKHNDGARQGASAGGRVAAQSVAATSAEAAANAASAAEEAQTAQDLASSKLTQATSNTATAFNTADATVAQQSATVARSAAQGAASLRDSASDQHLVAFDEWQRADSIARTTQAASDEANKAAADTSMSAALTAADFAAFYAQEAGSRSRAAQAAADVLAGRAVSTTALNLTACVASGKGHDYQVGTQPGQIASLDLVPWESLQPGDTVRIFYKDTPYAGKMLIAAQGTAAAPVRVCGVKSPTGQRPIIDGKDAKARAGLAYGDPLHESRSVILVKPLYTQAWQAFPSYIQIDGLEVRGAHPANSFTDSTGTVKPYESFGACIWLERGHNITIADNVIHDCSQGVFSKSTTDGAYAHTANIRLAGNEIYGNGIAGDFHMHNTYLQSVNVVYEFNRYGPLRDGAPGNAIKDRSVGTVVRYNDVRGGAYSLDLVEAEDFAADAKSMPAYRSTYVYGNKLVSDGSAAVVHYGGDHYGAASESSNWGEPNFRQGTLYFYNNTVQINSGARSSAVFLLSTTKEHAEIWDNVLLFDSRILYPALRAVQRDLNTALWQPNGTVTLGRNWLSKRNDPFQPSGWYDFDPEHPGSGELLGAANVIVGDTSPVDTNFVPLTGSAVVDAGRNALSAVQQAAVKLHPPVYQLDAAKQPVLRTKRGAAFDVGAVER